MLKKVFYPPFSIVILVALSVLLAGSLWLLAFIVKEKESWQSKYQGLEEAVLSPLPPGEKGEVGELAGNVPAKIAQAVFNTSGVIKEIGKDFVLVWGLGDNFSDRQPRELRILIGEAAIVSDREKNKRVMGEEGLKILKVGDNITVESSQNIRGRTEFSAKYINVIY